MSKEAFLQIRLDDDDKERFERAAKQEHLGLSTWARRILLQEVERYERESGEGNSGQRGQRR